MAREPRLHELADLMFQFLAGPLTFGEYWKCPNRLAVWRTRIPIGCGVLSCAATVCMSG